MYMHSHLEVFRFLYMTQKLMVYACKPPIWVTFKCVLSLKQTQGVFRKVHFTYPELH